MDEPHAVSEKPSGKGTGVWAGASLAAALLASACCLGPAVLSALGLSALGVSALFEPVRPYFWSSRTQARATLGRSLAVSAFPRYVPG